MGGSARFLGWTGGCRKWSFSHGLSRTLYVSPFLTKFTLLKSRIAPKTLKRLFLDKFQTGPLIFYPLRLPILGLSFKFYYAPPSELAIIEVTLAKISFSKLMPIQSYGGKTLCGGQLKIMQGGHLKIRGTGKNLNMRGHTNFLGGVEK